MGLLNTEEWSLLLFSIIITLIVVFINIRLIRLNQSKITFLHPGWILHGLIFFYGMITPIYILFNSKNYQFMNKNFLNLYTFDNFYFIFLMYSLVLFIFTLCEITLLSYLKNKSSKKLTQEGIRGWEVQAFIISQTILILLLLLNIVYNINLLGGINSNNIIDKVSKYEVIGTNSFSIPYTPLYQVAFLFWFNFLVKNRIEKVSWKVIYWIVFVLFTSFILYMGTTLQILMIVIGKLFIIYAYKGNILFRKWKKISVLLILLAIIFITSENYMSIKLNKVQKDLTLSNIFEFPDLTRFETITGYTPGLVSLADQGISDQYNILNMFSSILPSSLVNNFDINNITLTELIHHSSYNNTYGWYTVTFPVNMYPVAGIIGIVIIGFLIYLGFFFLIYYCFKREGVFIFFAMTIYSLLFYVIRIEFSQWVGKVRLYAFLSFLIVLLYLITTILLKNYVINTKGYRGVNNK